MLENGVVIVETSCTYVGKVDLMMVGAVQVDNVGDGQNVGECGVFFHKKMFEIACAQFDELNIHACAMDCWDWEGVDDVHGPDFS